MQLSPTGDAVATISSRFDVVKVMSLASSDDSNTTATSDQKLVVIPLPPAIASVTSLAFGQSSQPKNRLGLLCMACEIEKPGLHSSTVIVVASIAQ
eukprot:jgi/Phyca11/506822/fgenesh2_kg.PHYCAscaffold_22_\